MAKVNRKNEKFVKNAAKSLAQSVNDSVSYDSYINYMETLFEQYSVTEKSREKILKDVFQIMEKNNAGIPFERVEAEFNTFKVVSERDHIAVPTDNLNGIRRLLTTRNLVVGGIGTFAIAVTVGVVVYGKKMSTAEKSSNDNFIESPMKLGSDFGSDIVKSAANNPAIILNDEDVNIDINQNDQNPLLGFDPQDKQTLIDNIYKMFKNSMPKGHKVTKGNIAQEVANWTDAYITANIENIGPDFLIKYFQTDSRDSLSTIENYLRVVSQVDTDSQVSENSWNLDYMFANKADRKLISKYQELVSKIVKNTKAGSRNKEEVKKYAQELRKELEKLVHSNGSRQYSNAATVMAINLSFAASNVAKVVGMADVVIPSDLRKVLYTDGAVKCNQALAMAKKAKKSDRKSILLQYGGQDNVYMKAVLGMYEEVEADYDKVIELYSTLTEEEKEAKFSNEISYNNSQNTLIEKITKILDTYKANIKYVKLYYKNFKINSNSKTVKKKTIVVKSKTAKKITKKKKAGKKVTVKDVDSKDFIKGSVKGKSGKKVTTSSKNEQILVEEASKAGYKAGFSNGMSKGSAGKAKSIGSITVPSKYAKNAKASAMYKSQFKSGFSTGYSEGYKVYKENRDKKKEVTTGTKTEESGVKEKEPVKGGEASSNNSSSSNSSSSSKTEESDVYDIEDVQETQSVKANSEISMKLERLKNLKSEILSWEIEPTYEEEIGHTR